MKKERLDILLVAQGFAPSREKAKAMIMAGKVLVNDERQEKAGTMIDPNQTIRIKGEKSRFVSRGGYKLLKALEVFSISLEGKVCMDIGASTGGFTDCMLQHGAVKVYCIDSGTNQLVWEIRNHPHVVVWENTNARYLSAEQIPELADFVSIDVSFISILKLLDAVCDRWKEDGEMVCLIKPQFEVGIGKVGKKGVVRDPKLHEEVLMTMLPEIQKKGLQILGLDFSPIQGAEGNIEYLLYLKKTKKDADSAEGESPSREMTDWIQKVVKESHTGVKKDV